MSASLQTRFRRGVLFGITLGLLVYLGYAVATGWQAVGHALARFSWWLVVPLLALSLANYALRWLRWERYLRRLEIRVPTSVSVRVFVAGMAMTVTPGKVGELLKSYLLHEAAGVPASRSAPVVLVERLTDLISLVALASIGVAAFGGERGLWVLGAAALLTGGLGLVLRIPALTALLVKIVAKLPLVGGLAPKLEQAGAASRALLGPAGLAEGVTLGALAWGCECAGYWLAFQGFGEPTVAFDVSLFAYSFSTVLGVVAPGGLGPTDLGLIQLAQNFTPGLGPDVAAAASFLVRLATLWFAVALGAIALRGFGGALQLDPEAARRAGDSPSKTG